MDVALKDHIKIGRELDLFIQDETVGMGLPLLTPRGATLKRVLTRFIEDEEIRRGYEFTATPSLASSALYKESGHWDLYRDGMFVVEEEDAEPVALRPMTCPFQFHLYNRKLHTYRDLPVRYAETSSLFRNEASGSMHGLIRIRQFTLSEGHIICRPNQIEEEFVKVLALIEFVMDSLGLDEYEYRLSTWDPNNREKYIDNPDAWNESQSILRGILEKSGVSFYEAPGEAAFYGPKLDIQMKNVWGKEDTAITVQLDYALAERFGMVYINEAGEKASPVIIHRSSIGCYERTMALLIEKYQGKFPFWLAPQQVQIVTINDECMPFAEEVNNVLNDEGIRSAVYRKNESLRKKVRESQKMKIPVVVTIGKREVEERSVSVRTLDGKVEHGIPLASFAERCRDSNVSRTLKDFA